MALAALGGVMGAARRCGEWNWSEYPVSRSLVEDSLGYLIEQNAWMGMVRERRETDGW